MYWADRLVEHLDKNKQHRVDDQSTPSGHYHVGSLRAVATHALIYESMKHQGIASDFTYVFNDIDPMDGLPTYLDASTYGQHMGKPLSLIPAPDGESASFAEQYGHEFLKAFEKLGFTPTIFWTSKMYAEGKFDDYIRLALDNVDTIRKIYLDVAKQVKPESWYPIQVICPNCQKIGSTLVTKWDGTLVHYECKTNLVDWAVGCGQSGDISPFGGNAKLMWKVEWPASWPLLQVTVEGAGKDHMSAGGSHDIGVEITRQVFNYTAPFSFMNEFFLIGGAKMSSSKGRGMRAIDFFEILPATLIRFLLVRTPYKTAINFDPAMAGTIPDLFDEYDRCAKAWYTGGDTTDQGRMFQAAQISTIPTDELFVPRFRSLTKLVQMPSIDLYEYFAQEKGSALTDSERVLLDQRVNYVRVWLEKYAPPEEVFGIGDTLPESAKELSEEQKSFLGHLEKILSSQEFKSGDDVQTALFECIKEHGIASADAFKSIYSLLYGKTHGPKAGWVLFNLMQTTPTLLSTRLSEIS